MKITRCERDAQDLNRDDWPVLVDVPLTPALSPQWEPMYAMNRPGYIYVEVEGPPDGAAHGSRFSRDAERSARSHSSRSAPRRG